MKSVAILGSTGSVGVQSLDVIQKLKNFKVVALAANNNTSVLFKQAKMFSPKIVCVYEQKAAEILKGKLKGSGIKVVSKKEGLLEVASIYGTDIVVNALVGMVGLEPTIHAINNGSDIAIANKESIVTGGELILKKAREKNINILPVDSEHSAIFQALESNKNNKIKKILLTASGGPFYGKTKDYLKDITPTQAVKNPNWEMGKKISVDSATLMNKGLELIEASKLFNVSPENIEVVVHRQSIIHSAVEYSDNSVIAQMAVADMRLPIQYALTYPDRKEALVSKLDLVKLKRLSFSLPDRETFECLKACEQAAKLGGYYPTFVNAANELAVEYFLNGRISFLDIGRVVKKSLELKSDQKELNLHGIIKEDLKAKNMVKEYFNF